VCKYANEKPIVEKKWEADDSRILSIFPKGHTHHVGIISKVSDLTGPKNFEFIEWFLIFQRAAVKYGDCFSHLFEGNTAI